MNEWDSEPNHERFESSGLPCIIYRHDSLKHLCGYVGVPASHPMFGKDYDVVPFDDDKYPHGGLTYGSDHAPREKPDGHYWFGFDCAHAGDQVPTMDHQTYGVYRNWAYVRLETEKLASQLAKLKEPA